MIPLDDENWHNYLQLMKIMDYIFSPSTTEVIISMLRVLIEDFLLEFRNLYPERRITPKMHYLIHVPSWMQRYVFTCVNILCIAYSNFIAIQFFGYNICLRAHLEFYFQKH